MPHIDLPDDHLRGFHVALENSLIVSTNWGTGSFGSAWTLYEPELVWSERQTSAEMACWWADPDDNPPLDNLRFPDGGFLIEQYLLDKNRNARSMLEWDGDTVQGWVPAEMWWPLIEALSHIPKGQHNVGEAVVEVLARAR